MWVRLIAKVVTAKLVSSILFPNPKLLLFLPTCLSHDCPSLDRQSMRGDAVRRQVMNRMTSCIPVSCTTVSCKTVRKGMRAL